MIRFTFLKEIKELKRDGRVKIATTSVLLLLGVAIWITSKQYERTNQQYEIAKNSERNVWDSQGEKNPHSAAHYGTYAFKPKFPLSLLDQGVDKYVGTSIFLEAHNRNEAQFSAAVDQTGLSRFGDLTPDFILLFIIPLLIVFLGYNALTKERELGTLTLLKSQGISIWKLILGKWLALMSPILTISALLFIVAGILLSNLHDFGIFSWNSLITMFLVYMCFYIVFVNIVLFISAKSKTSGIALVLSLTIWILSCLAIPKIASNIAEKKYPYPTRQEFAANITQDKKQGLDGHNPWSEEAKQLEKNVLKEYGVDSLNQLPFNFDAYRMQKGEEHQAQVYFKHYNFLKEQYNNQTNVYKSLAILSPYLSTRFLSMSIAHTDYSAHWDFADAAENYRIEAQKFLNNNFAENSSYGQWSYRADSKTWKDLPTFTYVPISLKDTITSNTSNFTILGVWVLASFTLLFFTNKNI